MKLQLALFLIVASLFAYAYTEEITTCSDEDWVKFKEEYNKSYGSTEDDMSHYYTFCDNIKAINRHNENYDNGVVSYKLGVNKFVDLSTEELARTRGLKTRGQRKMPARQSSDEDME